MSSPCPLYCCLLLCFVLFLSSLPRPSPALFCPVYPHVSSRRPPKIAVLRSFSPLNIQTILCKK
jgi:hypothetical protein